MSLLVAFSTALLLPSGKVLVAGGEHRSSDYEIYVPPDLACSQPRPTIVSTTFGQGFQMAYNTDYGITYNIGAGAVIQHAVLMRPGTATHQIDFDQRYIKLNPSTLSWPINTIGFLSPSGRPGTGIQANRSPPAPPGWYMLFLVTSGGVPSVAHWVRLQ